MLLLPLIISWLAVILSYVNTLSPHPKVLLISFDGFRYDLLNASMIFIDDCSFSVTVSFKVPNIYKWATKSSWFVNGVRSQYITYTAPNHMSIVTVYNYIFTQGMYEQSHGIVSNYFYDTETGEFYDYFNTTQTAGVVNASQAAHWYRGEPIWLTNDRYFHLKYTFKCFVILAYKTIHTFTLIFSSVKCLYSRANSSRRSATFYWPNGETPFPSPPHKPTIYKYIAEPDHTLHGNGFYNGQLKQTLKQLDSLFAYFDSKFDSHRLSDEVNVILTADHGHAEVYNFFEIFILFLGFKYAAHFVLESKFQIMDISHVMCIRDYVFGDDFWRGDHMIYPKDEQHAREIYRNLTEAIKTHEFKVKVYMKEDFPDQFFYKNSSRVGRIIIEPEVGSAISFSCTKEKIERLFECIQVFKSFIINMVKECDSIFIISRAYGSKGSFQFNASTHGMDPNQPEMRAMLVMRGPAIIKSQKIEDIPDNIDLYSLMCYLLEISPAPHNGSLQVLQKVLQKVDVINQMTMVETFVTDSFGFLAFLLPSMCVVILFLMYGCRHTILKDDPNWAGNQNGYRPLQMEAVAINKNTKSNLISDSVSMSGLLKDIETSSEDEF
uniref:Bis(5'-adenosyl)-triphosphatase n=1 Tax=Heterorhabditis bacteriophora TaxID=37862 RepID=A0A1I7XF78_HETBA